MAKDCFVCSKPLTFRDSFMYQGNNVCKSCLSELETGRTADELRTNSKERALWDSTKSGGNDPRTNESRDIVFSLASIVILISFFLPWFGRIGGLKLIEGSFSLMDSPEVADIGLAILIFVVSPIVSYSFLLIQIVNRKEPSNVSVFIPIGIWAILFLYLVGRSNGNIFNIPFVRDLSGLGFWGTLSGMSIAALYQITRALRVPIQSEQAKEKDFPKTEKVQTVNASPSQDSNFKLSKKDSDYVICLVCGQENWKIFKYCHRCGEKFIR